VLTVPTVPTASTVAERLRQAIDASPLTQREIATQAGFPRGNVISMMKSGEMKVPLDRLPGLARALDIDPAEFLGLALREYHPDVHEALQSVMGVPLQADEVRLVRMYRRANATGSLKLEGPLFARMRALLRLARQSAEE
jgi:transcriptional regulator with XRE-family HTH domain